LEAPLGWKAQGGLLRKGPLDPRVQIDLTSPDGRATMRIGDLGIGRFTVPTQQMVRLGFTEGKPYPAGQPPTTTIMARYRSGHDFADLYGQARFSKMCRTLEPKSIKAEDPIFTAAHDGPSSTTAGEAVYRCVADGQEKVAFVYAETSLYEMQGVANWATGYLLSFVAPKDRAAATYTLLFHPARSFTENPQWHLRQLQITAAQAAAAMATFHRTLQETQARYERWSANMTREGAELQRRAGGPDAVDGPADRPAARSLERHGRDALDRSAGDGGILDTLPGIVIPRAAGYRALSARMEAAERTRPTCPSSRLSLPFLPSARPTGPGVATGSPHV
jgi:hypothetical protein